MLMRKERQKGERYAFFGIEIQGCDQSAGLQKTWKNL